MWEVEFFAEYLEEFQALEPDVQDAILERVQLLRRHGPRLGRPNVDTVKGSAFGNMKELRVQHKGQPWRILFVFDPTRHAILLVGGNKTGNDRWYKRFIPVADDRFRRHLEELDDGREI